MAIPMRRTGRFGDYFVDDVGTDPETAAGTVEDNAVELRALVPLLPPAPFHLNPRARWRRYAIAFAVSLAASTALLALLVRCVGP